MRRAASLLTALACLALLMPASAALQAGGARDEASARDQLDWTDLAPIPDDLGLGGPFVGTLDGKLVVAGGANFPNGMPWEDGAKVWHREIHVLDERDGEWRHAGDLPAARAYGLTFETQQGLLLLGGSDAATTYADAWLLTFAEDGGIEVAGVDAARLPARTAFAAGAAIDGELFVVPGLLGAASDVVPTLWSLAPGGEWRARAPYPGPGRHKAVAAAQARGDGEQLLLFSGERVELGADGKPVYDYRTDAFAYDPVHDRWTPLADSPRPIAASCALAVGPSHVLCFSGSPGFDPEVPLAERPLFPREVLAYSVTTDAWSRAGTMPQGVVTTGVVHWDERIVIASGEVRPGVRTPRVFAGKLRPRPASLSTLDLFVVALYLAGLIALGIWCSRRNRTATDYFLAGGRIPWWAAGLSIYSTQLSAITYLSLPAVAFARDWRVFPAMFTILAVAPIVVRFFIPWFRRHQVTSAYEVLEHRFGRTVRLFGSSSFQAFQLVRMGIVVYLPALALAAVTGFDIHLCILAMGVLATVYTVLGGMEAVVWTDVSQTVVLLGGAIAALLIAVGGVGDTGAALDLARATEKLKIIDLRLDPTTLTTFAAVFGMAVLNLGPYTTDQAVVQRYLSTRDEESAARGVYLNGLLAIPGALIFFVLGTALWAYFRELPELLPVGMKNDEVFPVFIAGQLPAGLAGLVVAGVFAASMSSLDSSMHSIATAFTTDFLGRREMDDVQRLSVARRVTVVAGLLGTSFALALATFEIRSVFDLFQQCLGLLSSGLVAIFLLGVFTRRSHSSGVLVGALASIAMLVWVTWFTDLFGYWYGAVGVGTGVLVGYLASMLLPSHDPVKES